MISSLKTKINYNYDSTIWKHLELLEYFDISILVFEEQEYKADLSLFFLIKNKRNISTEQTATNIT